MMYLRMKFWGSFFTLILAPVLLLLGASFALAQETDPPEITNVQVKDVTEDSLTVTWETDEEADSAVNYGLQPDLGVMRIPVPDRKVHSITLTNLEAGRIYYFRVVSADNDGNQGISADYKIQTSG
jgi:Purple acid Phosphatase, N-terminal domain